MSNVSRMDSVGRRTVRQPWQGDYICDDSQLERALGTELYQYITQDRECDRDTSLNYKSQLRNLFYPSHFEEDTIKKVEDEYRKTKYLCPGCNKSMEGQAKSIDHIKPVVEHFNQIGYALGPWQRKEWYNDVTNLRYMHPACNSRKGGGGERYQLKNVQNALRRLGMTGGW